MPIATLLGGEEIRGEERRGGRRHAERKGGVRREERGGRKARTDRGEGKVKVLRSIAILLNVINFFSPFLSLLIQSSSK